MQEFGVVDVLINVAALRPTTRLLDMSEQGVIYVMSVNRHAAARLLQRVLPGMIDIGWSRTINFPA